jgi:hypothetical protein
MFNNLLKIFQKARDEAPYVLKCYYDGPNDISEWQVFKKNELIFTCLNHDKAEIVCEALNDVYIIRELMKAMQEPTDEMINEGTKNSFGLSIWEVKDLFKRMMVIASEGKYAVETTVA